MNPALQPFAQHLEFLGYEITAREDSAIADHATHPSLYIFNTRAGAMFQMEFRLTDYNRSDDLEFFQSVNKLNRRLGVVKLFVDEVFFARICFPGAYDKQRFAQLHDLMQQDWATVLNETWLSKFVK